MDSSLKKTVLQKRLDTPSDNDFINDINRLTVEIGNEVLQTTFKVLAGIDVPDHEVASHWEKAQMHHQYLCQQLEREVDFTTTLSDYLLQYTNYLKHPCLVETIRLENVVHETIHDKLTGLFNRQYLDETYGQQISLAKRYKDDLAILFLDLDDFKEINDTYGHLAGDKALQSVGAVIMEEKRDSDIAARFGGEEFVLVMTRTDNISAFVLAERLRKRIEALTISHHGQDFRITVSGGIASYPFNTRSPEQLLRMADNAVYLAKGAGKNKIAHYKEEKRRYLRVKINKPVMAMELDFDNSHTFTGTSKDICVGGLLFENPEPLPLGALLKVQVPVTGRSPIIIIGHVVRVESFDDDRYDIGLTTSFKQMDKILNHEIAEIIHEGLDKASEEMNLIAPQSR